MINNRQQNGRRRGRGGNNGPGTGGGNGPRQGGQGRPDNGNRIDNRARGNASQLYEKYKNLASDSQRQGDRVNTEYYLQFADHYFRVLADQRGRFEDQQPRRQQRDDFDMDGDDDYGDEGEPIRAGEQQSDDQSDRQNDRSNDRYQDRGDRQDRQMRDDRPRNENRNENRNESRNDGQRNDNRGDRNDGQRTESPRYDNQRDAQRNEGQRNDAQRNEGQRSEGQRDDRPRRNENDARPQRTWEPRADRDGNRADGNRDQQSAPRDANQREPLQREPRRDRTAAEPRADQRPAPQEVAGQRRSDPPAEGESLEQRAETVLEADAPPPRRGRGRPRREVAPVADNAADTAPAAFDSDRLPPSLNIGVGIAAANDAGDEAPKPRRRRVRAAVEDTPDAAE